MGTLALWVESTKLVNQVPLDLRAMIMLHSELSKISISNQVQHVNKVSENFSCDYWKNNNSIWQEQGYTADKEHALRMVPHIDSTFRKDH